MKKVILAAALVSFFLAAFSVQGYAEEKKDEKTHITMGIKTWINSFDRWHRNDDTENREKSNTVVMVGPTLNISNDKYFAGVSYLRTFKDYEDTYQQPNYTSKDKDGPRHELDLSLGYYVHPRVGVFLGYKNIWFSEDSEEVDNGVARNTVTKSRSFGPLVGLTANYPIGQTGLTPFATYAHYWLRHQSKNSARGRSEANMPAESIEAGLAYTYRSITLTAGYKWQNMNSENERSTFKGTIFSINYGF